MSASTLLVRLLAIAAATHALPACGSSTESHEVCYTPGAMLETTTAPALPCLARDDARLSFLNPGCTEDFAVKSGPTQKTATSGASCCYVVEYTRIDGCQVGRPFVVHDDLVVARLVARADWS